MQIQDISELKRLAGLSKLLRVLEGKPQSPIDLSLVLLLLLGSASKGENR